jgi:hypothetical protein
MPNGGSDCCGTCCFNSKNKGEAGISHASDPDPDVCTIRNLEIPDAFLTYCANHPDRNPGRIRTPVGPVVIGDSEGRRQTWVSSPQSEEARTKLVEILAGITERPVVEYLPGIAFEHIVIWQLGEWGERRALPHLERILKFRKQKKIENPFEVDRVKTVELAQEALKKIRASLP